MWIKILIISACLHASQQPKPPDIKSEVLRSIYRQPEWAQKQWNLSEIGFIAARITKMSKRLKLKESILLALIEQESQWSKYATGYNADGTFDMGLTQQNSKWGPKRFLRFFGWWPKIWEFYEVNTSLNMMEEVLYGCQMEYREIGRAITCYNNESNAMHDRLDYYKGIIRKSEAIGGK